MDNQSVLGECRERGWAAVSERAPLWVRTFVTEYRSSVIEKRSINLAYKQEFNRGCEKRSAVWGQARKIVSPLLNKIKRPLGQGSGMGIAEARKLARENGLSFEDIMIAVAVRKYAPEVPLQDTLNSLRMKKITRTLAATTPAVRASLRDFSENGRQAVLRDLDIAIGKRPTDEQIAARPFGFTTPAPWEKK
jgi:hypothetical protein